MLPAGAPLLAVLLFAQSGRHAPSKRNWRLVPTELGLPYKLFNQFLHIACQEPRAYQKSRCFLLQCFGAQRGECAPQRQASGLGFASFKLLAKI